MIEKTATIPDIQPLPEGDLEVITTHINADFDALASMIAAGKLYPNATMVFPGAQEKNLRNFFIQSVVYLFNVARVKELEIDKIKRLILVDTRQADRIGALADALDNPDLAIHIYDHHPAAPDDLHGELEIISATGSNAAIMTEILDALGTELSPEEATVLILGIYEDTGSFTFRSTTPRDYRAAARLLEMGADLNVVSEMITRELTVDQVSLLNELINSAQVHTINGVEVLVIQSSTEHYVEELAVLVHKIMDIKNANVIFALAGMEGKVYMVARSRIPQVNVAEIAQQFGGGGHPYAAAATVKDMTLPQAVVALINTLSATLAPVRRARDIMIFPVISLKPENTLADADALLVRYNINVLLVVDDDGKIIGYLTRLNVSKALHHGMTEHLVSEYMVTEFGTVTPEATFADIQNLIVEQKQRIVPVVEDDRPVGVVTRTDLLNILTSETDAPGSVTQGMTEHKGRTRKIRNLMRERLPKPLLELLAEMGRTAERLGFGAYLVGGFVRDIFLRQENFDVDVVIEGDAIKFTDVFAEEHPGVRVRQHRKFNTAVLIFPDGRKVDVTTARLEYYESPGALPIVEKGSIRLDLYRRDFTINTLAVHLNPRDFGTVIDYFRGLKDIKEGYIRVLHNLSFVEDPTRVFRAIRFEQRFGFKIGKMTANLIQNAVQHDFFLKLSGKRLSDEVRLILQEDDPWPAVARMDEFDLLKFIYPDLKVDQDLTELFRNIKRVRDWFQLTYPKEEIHPWIVYLLGLLNSLKRAEMVKTCDRLKLYRKVRQVLVDEKPRAAGALNLLLRNPDPMPSDVFALVSELSTETILFMMARSERDEITSHLTRYFLRHRHIRPEVTGRDLIEMGLRPGPRFKRILDELQMARVDRSLKSREEELEYVKRKFIIPDPEGELFPE